MKKVIAIALAAVLLLSLAACQSGGKKDKFVVGVCQLVPHPALDAATQGFVDQLKAELGEDKVEIKVQDAAGDSNTCATIVNSFVSDKVDLIMANATPALQAAAAATKDIPVLGTSITEYGVALGLTNFNGTVGTNVSGTSDLAPLDQQADMLMEWFPATKTVGMLYCSAEANSQYQVDTVAAFLEAKGVSCTMYPFADSNDLQAVTQKACEGSDVIYVPTDNTAASATGIIDGVCSAAGVPVIVGEKGICEGCGVATLSIDYYDLGVATGKMAAKILKGEAKVAEMPIGYAETVTPMYNAAICERLGLTPVDGYQPIG